MNTRLSIHQTNKTIDFLNIVGATIEWKAFKNENLNITTITKPLHLFQLATIIHNAALKLSMRLIHSYTSEIVRICA